MRRSETIWGHWRMTIIIVVLGISACVTDAPGGGNVRYEMDIAHPIRPHLPYVKVEKIKLAVTDDESIEKLSSAIFEKTCCDGVDKQLLLECCCPDVLKLYEEKLAKGDWELIETLTSGDEVFAACRYHPDYQIKFEAIENKYLEEDDDEEWN